jgi:hypothetical protein
MKTCKKCKKDKPIAEFRTRPNGFTLNQCKACESAMGKERKLKKRNPQMITITSKSGLVIEASTTPIPGGRVTTSPKTNVSLYFNPSVSRDAARVAFSTFAKVDRTGIKFEKV